MASSISSAPTSARARQRLRLVAACGVLSAVALAAGGLGVALNDEPSPPPAPAPTLAHGEGIDPITLLERRVEAAETDTREAWSTLSWARSTGVDPELLRSYERRLEALDDGPVQSLRRRVEDRARQLERSEGGQPSPADEALEARPVELAQTTGDRSL